ncbi:MAG TPA: O-antigen ligase family protein, partial [Gaiellales bacterium]|nr:O-antigen ligase family protein [Gaiellales bacterium]
MAQTVDAARSARDPLPGVTERAVSILPLLPLILPMACWLWLAWRGGGYTINEWGMWAVVSAVAIAIMLIALGMPLLGWLPWVSPGALAGLTLLAWLSILWAAWPQNALVEGDRSLFYACVLVVCLLALGRVDGRRVAAGLVVVGVGTIALIEGWALWRMGDVSAFSFGRLVGGIGYGGGMAALVAVGVWPATAFAADRATPIALRACSGVAAGAAAALVVPTGSRAALVALVASGLIFAALCPTPVRCAAIAVPVLVLIAFRWTDLNSAFAIAAGETQVRAAGSAVMAAALIGGLAALAQSLIDRRVTLGAQSRRLVTGGAAALVGTLAVLLVVAFVAATNGKPGAWLDDKWQQFQVQDSPYRGGSDSRFGSVGTGRYDLWRVSVRLFREHPFDGVGAGNFLYDYAQEGRSEDQPFHAHSQVLEDASTLGLAGLLGLVLALGLPIAAAANISAGMTQAASCQIQSTEACSTKSASPPASPAASRRSAVDAPRNRRRTAAAIGRPSA